MDRIPIGTGYARAPKKIEPDRQGQNCGDATGATPPLNQEEEPPTIRDDQAGNGKTAAALITTSVA